MKNKCEECIYYHKENNTCQSKKCATGGDGDNGEVLMDEIDEWFNNKYSIADTGYVVKDTDTNEYFCGMNKWDKQLRKAVIYHSIRYAEQTINDSRFKNRNMKYVPVEIREVRE